MSNWDDEDYEIPVSAVEGNFDDEEEIGVLDDWEAAGESEDDTPSGPTRVRVPMAQRAADREKKEQEEREKAALAAGEEDAAAKKERLRKAEVDSDLNHAAALFGAVDIHPRSRATETASPTPSVGGPSKLSDLAIFKASTKQEFENLRKTLVPIITDLSEKSGLQFANFITDFVRDVCKPLSSDQARKVTSTLNALTNDKQREERANRGKKKAKPIVKENSLKIDPKKDTTNYEDFDDDDDFM